MNDKVQEYTSIDEIPIHQFLDLLQQETLVRLLLIPSFGDAGFSGMTGAVHADTLIDICKHIKSTSKTTFEIDVLYSSSKVSVDDLYLLGYAQQVSKSHWKLIDLDEEPQLWISKPRLTYPIPLPLRFFADQKVILIANLATHPINRMTGCLAALLQAVPEITKLGFLSHSPELVEWMLQIFPPDLCVLDARQIRRWDEVGQFKLDMYGRILVGTNPLHTDSAASQLLGFRSGDVPLLSKNQKNTKEKWIEEGRFENRISVPDQSKYFLEGKIKNRITTNAWKMKIRSERLIDKINLPKFVDFFKRVISGQ